MSTLAILFGQHRVVIGAKERLRSSVLGPLTSAITQNLGGLAGIVVDASVREQHVSDSAITDNPIEDGSTVADHVQVMPKQLTIEGVISDTPLGFAVIGNVQNLLRAGTRIFKGSSRSIDSYNDLLALQSSRLPFTVITSLKRYDNMILKSLSVPRDSRTGRAIHFTAVMQEIRTVKSREIDSKLAAPSVARRVDVLKDNGQKITDPIPAPSNLAEKRISLLNRTFN